MSEQQMIDSLQAVWKNMTMDKDRKAYQEMLVLLDNMKSFLYNDLQIEYPEPEEIKKGAFDF